MITYLLGGQIAKRVAIHKVYGTLFIIYEGFHPPKAAEYSNS
jgi:hypothetical protein